MLISQSDLHKHMKWNCVSVKKMPLKMPSAKCQPFYPDLNVLKSFPFRQGGACWIQQGIPHTWSDGHTKEDPCHCTKINQSPTMTNHHSVPNNMIKQKINSCWHEYWIGHYQAGHTWVLLSRLNGDLFRGMFWMITVDMFWLITHSLPG